MTFILTIRRGKMYAAYRVIRRGKMHRVPLQTESIIWQPHLWLVDHRCGMKTIYLESKLK